MKAHLIRFGNGLWVGALSGAVAFEIAAVVLFATHLFSSGTLIASIPIGMVLGVLGGPMVSLLQWRRVPASLALGSLMAALYIPYSYHKLTQPGVFADTVAAFRSLGASGVFAIGGGALTGYLTVWGLGKLPERQEPREEARPGSGGSRPQTRYQL